MCVRQLKYIISSKHIENIDKAEDKALAYIEEIIEEDTREVKEIKDSNRRSAMFVIN